MTMDLEPAHISWYELTIEPNTLFYRHPPHLPDENLLCEMQSAGHALLEQRGYGRYEVSAYAQGGRQCRHNLNYWQFGDYLGIGAGAHGKLTDTVRQAIHRSARRRHPRDYLDAHGSGDFCSARWELAPGDAILEFLMNALRLEHGFSTSAFAAVTGLPPALLESGAARGVDEGLLVHAGDRWHASKNGQRYLNNLLAFWLPETTTDAHAR
jgi:oxygen-independent coproporphyrinogen-3 oxidase